MAGMDFDDIINAPAPAAGGMTFDDITGGTTPDDERRARLRKIALAGLKQQGEPGAGQRYLDSWSLGLRGPVSGLASAVGGEIGEFFGGEPASFGERYGAGEGAYDEYMREAAANSGAGGTAASVAGMLSPGGAARGGLRALGIGGAMVDAGQIGAIQSAGQSRGSLAERVEQIGKDTLTSAGTAGLVNGVLGWRGRRAAARAEARGPTPETIRDAGRDLYNRLDQSGTAFAPQQVGDLSNDLGARLRNANIRAADMPMLEELTHHQGPMTLSQLQRVRTNAAELARDADPNNRRMAGVVLGAIDDYVGRNDPALTSLAPGEVNDLWRQARQHWRTGALTDDLGWNVSKAERRAQSTDSGGNAENAIRQNVRSVYDRVTRPGAYNPYGPQTMQQMNNIVEGTRPQNIMRASGKFLRSIPGASMTSGAGTAGLIHGLSTGDPTTIALSVGGPLAAYGGSKLLSAGSRNIAENAADALIGDVARSSGIQRAPRSAAEEALWRRYLERTGRISTAAGLSASGGQ